MFLDYQNSRQASPARWSATPLTKAMFWLAIGVLSLFLAGIIIIPKMTAYGPGNGLMSPRLDIHNISEALEQFHTDNGRYPTTAEGLQVLVQKPVGANLPNWQQILTAIPVDPWGHPYHYELLSGATKDFDLRSDGPDGKPNTADDISN